MDDRVIHNKTIIIRFLKETKLLPYWKAYINSADYKKRSDYKSGIHWADKRRIVDVFGHSSFTDFLSKKGIRFRNGKCTYLLFSAFLEAFYPEEYFYEEDAESGRMSMIIDKEKKTVRLILSNNKVWK